MGDAIGVRKLVRPLVKLYQGTAGRADWLQAGKVRPFRRQRRELVGPNVRIAASRFSTGRKPYLVITS